MRLLALMCVVVLAAACGGGSDGSGSSGTTPPPAKASATGAWIGSTGGQTLSMSLVDNNGVVSGSGSLTGSGGPFAQTISGTFIAPALTLTLTSGQHPPFTFQGTVAGTSINGALTGSGFTGDAITLQNTSTGAGTLSSVALASNGTTVVSNSTILFSATPKDKFGNTVPATVAWTSSASTIASVDQTGTVKGLGAGTTTITATATSGGATAAASQIVTATLSPLVGVWNLATVSGKALPASYTSVGAFTAFSQVLDVHADGTGVWRDSTTSTLGCTPVAASGPQCNFGGSGAFTWTASPSSLFFSRSAGFAGVVNATKLFTIQSDGTLSLSENQQTFVFKKS